VSTGVKIGYGQISNMAWSTVSTLDEDINYKYYINKIYIINILNINYENKIKNFLFFNKNFSIMLTIPPQWL